MSRKTLSHLVLRVSLLTLLAVALPRPGGAAELTTLPTTPGTASGPGLLASVWDAALLELGLSPTLAVNVTPNGSTAAAAPISPSRGFGIDPDGVKSCSARIPAGRRTPAPASPSAARRPQTRPSVPIQRLR